MIEKSQFQIFDSFHIQPIDLRIFEFFHNLSICMDFKMKPSNFNFPHSPPPQPQEKKSVSSQTSCIPRVAK